MRPPRPDIAAPPFPPALEWLHSEPLVMERLAFEGPVLVHFWEAAEMAPLRTVPYVRAWWERYLPAGLTVIGVHSPRYPFNRSSHSVEAASGRHGIPYPVALDTSRDLWKDYGCSGWPSLFLWAKGGALRWAHFGEGAYEETEGAIREALIEAEALRDLPEPVGLLRPSDDPAALLAKPTPEVRPGPAPEAPWEARADADTLSLTYRAGGAYAVVEGRGSLTIAVDEEPERRLDVSEPGLFPIAEHERHERHRLTLRLDPGMKLWALQFPPGSA